ncbi:hypothetical protein N7447_009883 [Penicillium robsamsonii]|uniref:uncharacterized protein n=1 Tax=Penicillium robsamsonii TaxID=1792511 RepID=UPI002549264C|nr:uncharacterized protein N7447_009883 [Penicillium robsamsonii]KAJ5812860.1 hypothetical protein N7447_009883 [Penicillium robsamsonii]
MSTASWLKIPSGSHFSLANIPFGIITTPASAEPHGAIAIGDHVLDLYTFAINIGGYLQDVFALDTPVSQVLKDNNIVKEAALFHKKDVKVYIPMSIAGYSDFFAGRNHAYNCGCIFRDPQKALQTTSTSLRPLGQFLANKTDTAPQFGACRRLDIELELGALLCKGNEMGELIPVDKAEEYIFGFVILNDWSARDI